MANAVKQDGLLRISLMDGHARAFLADTTETVAAAKRIHGLSRTATAALGRMLTATAINAAMLKNETDSVTCRICGGGPIGTVLAVGKPNGDVKGCVDVPDVELERNGPKLNVGGAIGTDGDLTVIKDQGLKMPYIGKVPLVSGEVAEDFTLYFASSEQTPSVVSLGVLVGEEVVSAGGLVVQIMPGATEADIQSVEYSTGMFKDISATLRDYPLRDAVTQLLLHLDPVILDSRPVRYRCDCSRERISGALIAMGKQELRAMIDEDGKADVKCHFCNKTEHFGKEELEALYQSALR